MAPVVLVFLPGFSVSLLRLLILGFMSLIAVWVNIKMCETEKEMLKASLDSVSDQYASRNKLIVLDDISGSTTITERAG